MKNDKIQVNYNESIFVHFTYCKNMSKFPIQFHELWNKYFENSRINDTTPILGTKNHW